MNCDSCRFYCRDDDGYFYCDNAQSPFYNLDPKPEDGCHEHGTWLVDPTENSRE